MSQSFTVTSNFENPHFGNDEENKSHSIVDNPVDSNDLDIEFNITDPGRTVAHLIANMKQDTNNDDEMDFSVTSNSNQIESFPSKSLITPTDDITPKKSTPRPIPNSAPTSSGQSSNQEGRSNSFESYGSSGTAFVSGLMSNQSGMISHTPPTGSSYEARHFGKRPRAGSVSGRLRSASDLEDKGIIDRNQKGVLKDLIISGDEALQEALDKYEKGDKSQLESMIKNGLLSQKLPADMDFLGDLDLDFLTVGDDVIGSLSSLAGQPTDQSTIGTRTRLNSLAQSINGVNSVGCVSNFSDGIGDLEFSNDLSCDNDNYPRFSSRSNSIDLDNFRFRSNSLRSDSIDARDRASQHTFSRDQPNPLNQGVLSIECQPTKTSSDGSQQPARWMDQPVPGKDDPPPLPSRKSQKSSAKPGGIGASLAEYNRTTTKMTKAQLAEEKRRERQLKREMKEREKQELKERKERERKEKREQKEREKLLRKEKKAQKAKQKQEEVKVEEPKVIQSGTGRPRSMSDPNIKTSFDSNGLLQVDRPEGWVGAYSPESRKIRIERFMEKRNHRVWTKSVKYDVRKNFADSRLRVKGRFVKKEDELLMRELMSLT